MTHVVAGVPRRGHPSARPLPLHDVATRATAAPSVALLIALWVLGGVLMSAQLGRVVVGRSQEARVLQTAREMLGALEGWLLPRVNGHPRMQKPPLAYWLTAGSYKLFGTTNEAAGRLPAALAGWLTLGLTGLCAAKLFGRRAAFFAGASLLASVLFFRHARLAETDVLVTLFVTAGCWAAWRATTPGVTRGAGVAWSHAAAAAVGLAAMTKGPPAVYPLLFLLAVCVVERRWRTLLRTLLLSGAPLTFALVALPWFWYAWIHPSSAALVKDLQISAEGGKGHWDWPLVYAYQLPLTVAPWTGALLVAVAVALPRVGRDLRLRRLLIWVGVILLPLCFWGNKQRHYLLPLVPPLMILTGWYVDRALRAVARDPDARLPRVFRGVALLTTLACFLAVPVVLVVGPVMRASGYAPGGADVLLALTIAACVGASVVMARTRGLAAGLATFALAAPVIVYASFVSWSVALDPVNPRGIAEAIRARYGEGVPLAFVRREYLPLCYNLDRIIPVARNEAELAKLAESHPAGLIAIDVRNEDGRVLQAGIVEELRFTDADGNTYVIGPLALR